MNLTFRGFLKNYCRELAGANTLSLRVLCQLAASTAPRLTEPLFCLAAATDKVDYLLGLARNAWMEPDYTCLADRLAALGGNLEELLTDSETPRRYQKVWEAYLDARDPARLGRMASGFMRKRANMALATSGTTVYRLCKDLNLNKGNVYAYLNRGDTTKVSAATARRILDYALAQAASAG